MTSNRGPTFRLVKCPKCCQLLTEFTDVPVYKCGGCDTVLRAKNQNSETRSTESGVHEANAVPLCNDLNSRSQEMIIPSSAEHCPNLDNGREQDALIPYNAEQPQEAQPCNSDLNSGSSESESGNTDGQVRGVLAEPCLSAEVCSCDEDESLRGDGKMEVPANEESLPFPEGKPAQETCDGELNSQDDHPMTITGCSSQVTQKQLLQENISSSNNPLFSSGVQTERLQGDIPVHRALDRNRMLSRETYASTEYVDPVSEFSDGTAETPTSPTARSSHAYEGSVSSYDAFEDQYHENEPNFVHSKERQSCRKYQANDSMSRDSVVHQLTRPNVATSSYSDLRHYGMNGGGWVRHGMAGPSRHGYLGRRMRSEGDHLPPQVPPNARQTGVGYSGGSSSTLVLPQPDKFKLLKMVYELEDQLKKTCNLDEVGATDRVSAVSNWQERNGHMYYNRGLQQEGDYLGLNNRPLYPGRSERRERWQPSKIPFSAEMARRSYQVDHAVLHHLPHLSRRSEPLTSPTMFNRSIYGISDPQNLYSPYSSRCSSPQWYMDYEVCGDSEASPYHHMHKNRELDKYFRDNHHLVKRHFRPIAGGAPLITCDKCSELLHLPADFLLFKKRCHWLRCGACKTVLKFSVQNRIHVVPYVRDAEAPPPSEADDYEDRLTRMRYPSISRASGFTQADPVSYSDDYGLSICKSCSTEGDPASSTQFLALEDTRDHRRVNFSLDQSNDRGKSPLETYESVCCPTPDRIPSNSDELLHMTTSPLHQLMGYTSVSQVFRGRKKSYPGSSSSKQQR